MMCGVQQLSISPLGAQFTKMAANGSVQAFCVLTFHNVGQSQLLRQGLGFLFLLFPHVSRN
jgi:uncharacterized membrane protein